MTVYHWASQTTPPDLIPALELLAEQYPALTTGDPATGSPVVFEVDTKLSGPVIELHNGGVRIRYAQRSQALRALGAVLAGEREGREEHPFTSLGLMLDCSRNAVMTPAWVKRWLRQSALLGYNQLMLYTEDTYILPDEPYFGYQRGGYTEEDLRELDHYAHTLGIELVGCIQTLGHLEQALKWSPYWEVKDTASVLLVDDDRTYALIDKMLAVFARSLRSRRIHVGMDETHDLGRGRFLDRFGYEHGYTLFQRHLGRVRELCRQHGLTPMCWSDMYFRMGNTKQSYYDPATRIPDYVKAGIPPEAQLVYWDYEHKDVAFYEDWIQRHRDLDHEPVMASGIYTWGGHFWYAHHRTQAAIEPCVAACRNAGVSELFFTLWGDDGAFCEFDSAWAGIVFAAELE